MSKETEKKLPQVHEQVEKFATIMDEHLSVEGNKITIDSEALTKIYEEAGVTEKEVKHVQTTIQRIGAAMGLSTGKKSVEVLKDNKDYQEVTANLQIPNGRIFAVTKREVTVRNPFGEPTNEIGYTQVRIATKVPGGQIKAIRARIGELAAKAKLA